jgi:hypothetical protein
MAHEHPNRFFFWNPDFPEVFIPAHFEIIPDLSCTIFSQDFSVKGHSRNCWRTEDKNLAKTAGHTIRQGNVGDGSFGRVPGTDIPQVENQK